MIAGQGNRANIYANDNLILGHVNNVSTCIHSLIAGVSNIVSSSIERVTRGAFVSGGDNRVMTSFSHTEGRYNSTFGYAAHIQGLNNTTLAPYSHTLGLCTHNKIPCSQTYGNGFFVDGLITPVIGSAQTNIVTMTCGTSAANTYKPLFYWNPATEDIRTWNTNWSTLSTIVMSNESFAMTQTYNIALTAYNSNGGGTAGKGYYYAEYKASLYFDTPATTLYIGNIVGNTFTVATASPVTLTATSAANNLANAPTITFRARANVLNLGLRAAHIGFEVASSDARVTNYYAHIRIDEMMRPVIDPYF